VETKLLDGKRVLIVDDEPDVLETLAQLLPMCDVKKASTFEGAKELIEKEEFDIAVLDIMGVDGYKLLEISKKWDVIAVMLTAHALSPANIVRSFKGGAASYIPNSWRKFWKPRRRENISGGGGLTGGVPFTTRSSALTGRKKIRSSGKNSNTGFESP
jgi:CheY-like chemotaxis protein